MILSTKSPDAVLYRKHGNRVKLEYINLEIRFSHAFESTRIDSLSSHRLTYSFCGVPQYSRRIAE